jgi:hypothetical protein
LRAPADGQARREPLPLPDADVAYLERAVAVHVNRCYLIASPDRLSDFKDYGFRQLAQIRWGKIAVIPGKVSGNRIGVER